MRRQADGIPPARSDRHQELVKIAYNEIVDKGFEGLRIRDVAAKAGVNNATLHYYFPTKESLIQSVVQYLMTEFQTQRLPNKQQEKMDAIEAIRNEFEDMRYRLSTMPEMFTVLSELALRARRDQGIAELLSQTKIGWSYHLRSLLAEGMQQGLIRKNLDMEAAIDLIMLQMSALGYQVVESGFTEKLNRVVTLLIHQTERFLTLED